MKICKYISIGILGFGLILSSSAQDGAVAGDKQEETPILATEGEKKPPLVAQMQTLESETNMVSYALGVNMARNLQYNYPQINLDFFIIALRDVLSGKRLKLSEQKINEGIVAYSKESGRIATERVTNITEGNLAAAEKFLDLNAKKEGVVTTESGLQYREIYQSSGPKPKPNSEVKINLTVRLINGDIIESTLVDNKGPMMVNLSNTIEAWKEVIPMMNIGSKWEVYTHPKLAYGETGAKNVGPNQLLIFRIELLQMSQ
jgi:FKBP-type peptidyl-prolyl cis-trans isomerase FklB